MRALLTIGAVLLASSCGTPRCNPPGALPTHYPGTCTEAGTACSQHGYCEPCGHPDEICCAGNTCLPSGVSCQVPNTLDSFDGVCR